VRRDLYSWADGKEGIQTYTGYRKVLTRNVGSSWPNHAMHPLVAEVVGARFLRRFGIGTSNIEIVSAEEARRRDPFQWLVKTFVGSRLRISPPGWHGIDFPDNRAKWVVVSEKIPGAISLFYLQRFHGIDLDPPSVKVPNWDWSHGHFEWWLDFRLINLGKDQLPEARAFYSDFKPPDNWEALKNAIRWNSVPMLQIHAARLFLGVTTAHVANILVDGHSNLYTIDCEFAFADSGDSLTRLFSNIIPRTRAFESLRPVAEMRESELGRLFADLPEWVEWPLGSKEVTVEYYRRRLRLWKKLYQRGGVERKD